MDPSHFNSYLRDLKSIDLIPFFIEYLDNNHYISSPNLSKAYLREKIELSHYNPHFNRFARILTFKFKVLVQVGIKLGFLEIYNSSVFEVSNRKGLNLKIILDGLKKARISNNCSNNSNFDLNFRLNKLDKEKLDGIIKKERKSRSFILRCLVNDFLNKMDQDNQNKRLKLMVANSSKQTKILNFNINFGIKKEIKEKLDKIAKQNELNLSLILRGLLDNFIKQYENKREKEFSNGININLHNKSLYS